MRYEGTVYRPPSEARSLILQLTIGCARNQCTFCSMYKDKTFRIRPLDEVVYDMHLAKDAYPFEIEKVFLADGDAIIVNTEDLLFILQKIHEILPSVRRITAYGAPKDILLKTDEEWITLKNAGLEMIYMGAESGNDSILNKVKKQASRQEIIDAGQKLKRAGIKTSITLISGLGGKPYLKQHALDSATLINEINPEYASLLTLMLEPGTEMYEDLQKGIFQPLETPEEILNEMKIFLEHIDSPRTIFRANHASNYLPLGGTFNVDIPKMLDEINAALVTKNFRPDCFRSL